MPRAPIASCNPGGSDGADVPTWTKFNSVDVGGDVLGVIGGDGGGVDVFSTVPAIATFRGLTWIVFHTRVREV